MKVHCLLLITIGGAMLVLGSRARQEIEILRVKANAEAEAVVKRQTTRIRKHASDLMGEDHEAVKKAIRYFTQLEEPRMVAIALEYPADSMKVEAARSLQKVGNREVVPEMLAALKAASVNHVEGGADAYLWRRDVRKNILVALDKITGLNLKDVDVASEESVANGIKMVEEWMKHEGGRAKPGDSAK